MYINDRKLPRNIDRHILSDGQACLGINAQIRRIWDSSRGIVAFLEQFVAPFFAWQAYYDAFQKPPPWGERQHGKAGILEFYAEVLGIPAGPSIIGFVDLLARKNGPEGHELCPCGEGKRLRDCHRHAVSGARERVLWEDARRDLLVLKEAG